MEMRGYFRGLDLATEGDTALVGMGLLFDCSLAMEPSRGVLRIARSRR